MTLFVLALAGAIQAAPPAVPAPTPAKAPADAPADLALPEMTPVAPSTPVAPIPDRKAIEAKAIECGIKPAGIIWKKTEDKAGDRAFLWQIGKNATKVKPATCLLTWAGETRANVEWVAIEPAGE